MKLNGLYKQQECLIKSLSIYLIKICKEQSLQYLQQLHLMINFPL
ncbi:unnamed protein product [Paramecium primaurelia]|uniref:Uncharacterized protein n=1 Tax=Paramecium primaurelia TaxID=5886 RepID=A0A8S1M7X9_PARPR|nr:unnamed protein product [Paramecium primaurelia]